MNIFLVVGESGEFEEFHTWNVKAFKDAVAANDYIAAILAEEQNLFAAWCDARKRPVGNEFEDRLNMACFLNGDTEEEWVNKFDPGLHRWGPEFCKYKIEMIDLD